ncbi:MAG: hypothetical protein RMK29_16260 [Myxococcales bacterium]|nr:hypothetical protein [Myxococcota bacterium]MDW8283271.1 hypothetical protein [Myxococcales bacterium]
MDRSGPAGSASLHGRHPPKLQPALGALLGGAFRGGQTLGQIVEAAAATLPPPERPLALALAATQLATLFPQHRAPRQDS